MAIAKVATTIVLDVSTPKAYVAASITIRSLKNKLVISVSFLCNDSDKNCRLKMSGLHSSTKRVSVCVCVVSVCCECVSAASSACNQRMYVCGLFAWFDVVGNVSECYSISVV